MTTVPDGYKDKGKETKLQLKVKRCAKRGDIPKKTLQRSYHALKDIYHDQ